MELKQHAFAVIGNWRNIQPSTERKVRQLVEERMRKGDTFLSTGEWGIDFIATDEALIFDSWADRIKIFLPTNLDEYEQYYNGNFEKNGLTVKQLKILIGQLRSVHYANPQAIVSTTLTQVTDRTLRQRNDLLVAAADEIYIFQNNPASLIIDCLEKAKKKRIPVTCVDAKTKLIPVKVL